MTAGNLDVRWHPGHPVPKFDTAPPLQVHAYDDRTLILRQNKALNYEAPFLFLLIGDERALLLDTGATADPAHFPLRATVDDLIGDRELVVAHTHGHGDHVAADGQFADRPRTTVVGRDRADVIEFFGFRDWPEDVRQVDLGGRVLDLIPGPGHQDAAVVFYDRETGILFTGDTLYPGRLYVFDLPAYTATIDRLIGFCGQKQVSHVLGCHIEMTSEPGVDYPIGSTYQPDEPPLQLTPGHLRDLRAALAKVDGRHGVHVFAEFVVHHHAVHRHL